MNPITAIHQHEFQARIPQRVPIAALTHRRASSSGEFGLQRESMNCKSCRKKKIKCNRTKPSCGACLAFQCPCIYDAVPKKRGPKTEVLEELLKRVSGLEKQLQHEKGSRAESESPTPGTNEDGLLADVTMDEMDMNSSNGDTSPTPLLTPPIGIGEETIIFPDYSEPPVKKRRQSEPVFMGHFQHDILGMNTPSRLGHFLPTFEESPHILPTPVLPSEEPPNAMSFINAFFTNFHGKPYEIIHEATFRSQLASSQLPLSQLHAVCAIGAHYLSSNDHPSSPDLSAQYANLSRSCIDIDAPSFENFQTLLLLTSIYFALGRGRKSYMLLGAAARMAYALNLHHELPEGDPTKAVEREVKRRAFWACYIMDRISICGSRRPAQLAEDSIRLRLPSKFPSEIAPRNAYYPSVNVMAVWVDIVKILGTAVKYVEQSCASSDTQPPWHPTSKLTQLKRALDVWALHTKYLFAPSAGNDRPPYLDHPDVTRLAITKAIFHLVHILIYRAFLPLDLRTLLSPTITDNQLIQDPQITFRIIATRAAFKHANALSDVVESLRRAKQSSFPSITGYCLATAATVHLHGIHYVGAAPPGDGNQVFHHAGTHLVREMRLLRKVGERWACARIQCETLKRLISAHEELVREVTVGGGGVKKVSPFVAVGGFWERYVGWGRRREELEIEHAPVVECMLELAARDEEEERGEEEFERLLLGHEGVGGGMEGIDGGGGEGVYEPLTPAQSYSSVHSRRDSYSSSSQFRKDSGGFSQGDAVEEEVIDFLAIMEDSTPAVSEVAPTSARPQSGTPIVQNTRRQSTLVGHAFSGPPEINSAITTTGLTMHSPPSSIASCSHTRNTTSPTIAFQNALLTSAPQYPEAPSGGLATVRESESLSNIGTANREEEEEEEAIDFTVLDHSFPNQPYDTAQSGFYEECRLLKAAPQPVKYLHGDPFLQMLETMAERGGEFGRFEQLGGGDEPGRTAAQEGVSEKVEQDCRGMGEGGDLVGQFQKQHQQGLRDTVGLERAMGMDMREISEYDLWMEGL